MPARLSKEKRRNEIKPRFDSKKQRYKKDYYYYEESISVYRTFQEDTEEECINKVLIFQEMVKRGEVKTKKEVEEEKRLEEVAKVDEELSARRELTLEDVCRDWLERCKTREKAMKTLLNYSSDVRLYILPHFKDKKTGAVMKYLDIKADDVVNMIENLKAQEVVRNGVGQGKTLSYRMIDKAYKSLRLALKFIMKRDKLMAYNPCDDDIVKDLLEGWKKEDKRTRKKMEKEGVVKAFTETEAEDFIRILFSRGYRLGVGYLMSLCYGLRPGEVLGAKFSDIDYDNKILRVERDIERVGEVDLNSFVVKNWARQEGEVKSESSDRPAFLSELMINILEYHKSKLDMERDSCKNYNDFGYICSSKTGNSTEPRNYNRTFVKIMSHDYADPKWGESLGLSGKVPHSCRHYFATRMGMKAKVPPRMESYFMGHAIPNSVTELYKHVFEEYAMGLFVEEVAPHFVNLQQIAWDEIQRRDPDGTRRYK